MGNIAVLDRTIAAKAEAVTTERVVALVHQFLAKRSINRPVGADEDLTAAGLSSLDIVNLMLSIEVEFDVKIPDQDMTPSNFRSIARIDALVGTLLNGTQLALG